ncbi:MAG: hydroxymethylbilane synthase [Bacteroidota bacterium]
MTDNPTTLRLGTRTSALAMWQAEHVAASLRQSWPTLSVELVPFVTQGDRMLDQPLPEIGGKGLFTAELESALRKDEIDLAVHSLKDLPTEDPDGLVIGAILERADPRDAWVCPEGYSLAEVPAGASVGTSSHRRASQILKHRPDLVVESIRGNVGTRIEKVRSGAYDAAVLAVAGLERLGRLSDAQEILDLEVMLPAPAQGALAVQVRADDKTVGPLVAAIDHATTRREVEAERYLLAALGGGCSAPVAALATESETHLRIQARVLSLDGHTCIDIDESVSTEGVDLDNAALALGEAAAHTARDHGADLLLRS